MAHLAFDWTAQRGGATILIHKVLRRPVDNLTFRLVIEFCSHGVCRVTLSLLVLFLFSRPFGQLGPVIGNSIRVRTLISSATIVPFVPSTRENQRSTGVRAWFLGRACQLDSLCCLSSAKNRMPRFWPKPEGICDMIATLAEKGDRVILCVIL